MAKHIAKGLSMPVADGDFCVWVSVENLRAAMRGIANAVVPPIRVWATLTLAWHAIGWSGKNLDRQLREACKSQGGGR